MPFELIEAVLSRMANALQSFHFFVVSRVYMPLARESSGSKGVLLVLKQNYIAKIFEYSLPSKKLKLKYR